MMYICVCVLEKKRKGWIHGGGRWGGGGVCLLCAYIITNYLHIITNDVSTYS